MKTEITVIEGTIPDAHLWWLSVVDRQVYHSKCACRFAEAIATTLANIRRDNPQLTEPKHCQLRYYGSEKPFDATTTKAQQKMLNDAIHLVVNVTVDPTEADMLVLTTPQATTVVS